MEMTEFDYNIASGEFADTTITLTLDTDTWSIPAIVSKKYARKEVDGRYTTDLPNYTVSVTIAESNIPSGISSEDWRLVEVTVDGETYGVRYVAGTGLVTLTLKPISDDESEEIDDSVSDDDEEEVE